jgi:hypothetical protein
MSLAENKATARRGWEEIWKAISSQGRSPRPPDVGD